MKKFFKALALVLALALVIGVVPAQATSAKIKAKKTLYVDGAKGENTDGTKKSSYKERIAIYKLAGAKKADKEDHKFTAKIKSGDSVTVSKNYVYAAGLGKSVVELFKDGESLGTSVITVKKNADEKTLTITGLENGQEVVCGVEYTVTLPRKGVDTDERRLFVDDKAVADKEDAPRAYAVRFTTAGDHKIKFEGYQSAELDKATYTKEITVKAIMPQPTKIKQLSANSFAVIFDSDMTDLIDTSKVKNDDIYYMIAGEKITTGANKSVVLDEKDPTRVIVTRYTNFIEGETYYFHYGDSEDLKFVAAVSKLANVEYIKVSVDGTCYVDAVTGITVKYFDKNDVELDLAAQAMPVLEITSATDCAYQDTTASGKAGIWFTATGTAKIKATVTLGYNEETFAPIEKTDTLEVEGVKKGATEVKTVNYTFGTAAVANIDVTKNIHFIRLTETYNFKTQFKDVNGDEVFAWASGDTTGYYLKSTSEDIAQIAANNTVVGVNVGNAVILLCYLDENNNEQVLKAFPVEVKEANKGTTNVTATLSKSTLNIYPSFTAPDADDFVNVEVKVLDLNGEAYAPANLTYTWKQVDNNQKSTGALLTVGSITSTDSNNVRTFRFDKASVTLPGGTNTTYATTGTGRLAFELTVKETTSGAVLATKTFSVVVANVNPATLKTDNNKTATAGYKLDASKSELDVSKKNFKNTSALAQSNITVVKTGTVNGAQFYLGTEQFTIIKSTSSIPVSISATTATAVNYLVPTIPYGTDPSGLLVKTNGGAEINVYNASTGVSATGVNSVIVSNFADNTIDLGTNNTGAAKTGTYSFAGVRVNYATADGGGYKQTGSRISLGSVATIVKGTDATASYSEKAGVTASNIEAVAAGTAQLSTYFKVTWDGISSDAESTDTANYGRITISLDPADIKIDSTTDSVYVYKITAVIKLYNADNTNGGPMQYTVKIPVNKLYKD